MNKDLKKIAISGQPISNKNKDITYSIVKLLEQENKIIYMEEIVAESDKKFTKYSTSNKEIKTNCDLLISIGGDGTMLRTAKEFGLSGIPILGINLGSLGFLTDIAPENIQESLISILKGKFTLDKRFFLKTEMNSKILKQKALNEIVLHSGAVAKMIEFDVFVDNSFVYKQRSDGLIVFTSTGSTAYSLSGGGPLIHPDLNVIGIMPMFPHSLNTTPILIDYSKKVKIILTKINSSQDSELSFDGQNNLIVEEGFNIVISRSKESLSLIHPLDNDYFYGCRSKLGWGKLIVD